MNDNNEESLKMLVRAISFARGQFSLILAHCNYTELREELTQHLRTCCPVVIRQLVLDPSVRTLEGIIHAELESEPPSALMISGLELVGDLEAMLTAANNARDEFRKKLPFPLVLWVTDEVEQKMRRIAPDFTSWAAAPIEFNLPTDRLMTRIEQATDAVFLKVEEAGADRFLDNSALKLTRGSPLCQELFSGRAELKRLGCFTPRLEASLEFVLGRAAAENLGQSRYHYEQSLALFNKAGRLGSGEGNQSELLRKKGCVLFSLGSWWRSYGVRYRGENHRACGAAKVYFQQAVATFEQAKRPDLVTKFINALGDELQRLERWPELEAVARKARDLHETYGDIFRLARAYGFLAEVALAKKSWRQANSYAQQALDCLKQVQESDNLARELSYYRGCYWFSLARAHKHQGKIKQAIANLETAQAQTLPHYDPLLYIRILEELRSSYFQQGKYRTAYKVKQAQQSVESQFGFRAFIGAGRLSPSQLQTNYALAFGEAQEGIAPEIAASGREQDVHRLVDRMGRNDNKLTVICGPSGVGKSSILQAGLIPALQSKPIDSRDVLPVLQRVYTNWMAELDKCLAESLLANKSVGEPPEGLGAQLDACPIEMHPTRVILDRLRSNAEANLLTVLIFDQFEELFFACQDPRQRQEFYEFLKKCLDIEYVKVILSLREDYLYYLLECNNRLVSLEVINNNILDKKVLYYLGNFQPQDAKAVIRSLTEQSQFHLEEALLDKLVNELAAELSEVRPIELQVVGAQLQTEDIKTLAEYQENSPKKKLVERYLAEVVNDCGEENKQIAELVLYLLTDENNTRPLKTRAELKKELKKVDADLAVEADKLNLVLDLVLDLLLKAGLVFEVPETPAHRYQMVHDYLVPFIRQQQGGKLLAKLKAEREQRKLSEKRLNRFLKGALSGSVAASLLLAILSFGTVIYARRATNNEILVLSQSSKHLFASERRSIDSLITALKAGIKVRNKIPEIEKWWIKPDPRNQALTALLQAVYGVRERNELQGHDDEVLSVAFSSDGKAIASASRDGTVKLWQAEDGQELLTFRGHDDEVYSLAFSPDAKTIASVSRDGTVKLWQAADGQEILTLKGHDDEVLSVAFSPDGKTIASTSRDGTIKLWQADNGREIMTLKGHEDEVLSVAFSPEGKTIASASRDGTIKVWQAEDGRELLTLKGPDFGVVAFSPDGKTIASASRDGTIKVWQADDGQEILTLKGHDDRVLSVAFSPEGKRIVSASRDGIIKLWRADNGQELLTLKGHDDRVYSVAFSPEGKRIVSASRDATVKVWQADDGQGLQTLTGHDNWVIGLAFSPEGKAIASASRDKTVKVWQVADGQEILTLTGHDNWVIGVAFSPDGKLIASASLDGTVKVWQADDGQELLTLTGHDDGVWGVAFSPEGKLIASASLDGTVKLWRGSDGQEIRTIKVHDKAVYSVAFSPEGKLIASASYEGTVKVWQVSDGQEILTLKDHDDWVIGVAFSPEGQIIASASRDGTVKLWKADDGQELVTLKGHDDEVWGVAFSPSGKLIASADIDGKIVLWNLDLDQLLVRGCNWARDYLQYNPHVDKADRDLCEDIGTDD